MDIEQLKQETAGLNEVTFLNAAGSSISPDDVYNAMSFVMDEESRIGGYHTYYKYTEEFDVELYQSLAKICKAKPEEMAIVQNATDAWQKIFYGLAQNWQDGDVILSSTTEYGANLVAFLHIEKLKGVKTIIMEDDEFGAVCPQKLDQQITALKNAGKNIKLIALSHMPSNNGVLQPAEEIGKVANKHEILYLLDACQSVGQYPLDVKKLGCDFLTATARKFLRGPRGIGFLYISEKQLETFEPAMLDFFGAELEGSNSYKLRKDARRFEDWENSYMLRAGLHAALDYNHDLGIHKIWKRSQIVSQKMREAISELDGMKITDLGKNQSAIITCYHESIASEKIREILDDHKIYITLATSNSAPWEGDKNPKPVCLRFSPHYYNDKKDTDFTLEVLQNIIKKHK